MSKRTSCIRTSRIGLPLILLSCALLFAWIPAAAQESSSSLEQLEIALWPEYDQPAMLVIYRFRISSDIQLPAVVELPIPADTGAPHAVAWQDSDAGLFDASYELIAGDPWTLVQIEMEQSRLGQLEFYAEISFEGAQRAFEFKWPGTIGLGGFSYEVQQPIGSVGLTVQPAPESEGAGPFGMNYLRAQMGPIAIDRELSVSVTYQKDSPLLSADALQPLGEPVAPVSTESGSANLLPWMLAGAGLILIAGGLLYYTRGRARPAPRRKRKAVTRDVGAELEASAIFCHQCGVKARVNDVFCRNCGTRLRKV
jgi:hypothetical protein